MNLNQQSVLVLGLGESGLAIARWCVREGASVRVADSRAAPPQRSALAEALPDVAVHCGDFPLSLLDGVNIVAISPGLAPAQGPQADLLAAARERGIAVWGEIEFFAQKLASLKEETGYAPRVLAITGTNGKTTVTSLTGKLVARAGLSVGVAGNISPPALAALGDAMTANALPQVWVLELSSFQLETAYSFAPDAATVLNVTQDHLDWHGGMEAYAAAKARIFAPATTPVLNRGDARVMAMVAKNADFMSFGLDAPDAAESFGIVLEGGMRWLGYAEAPEADAPTGKRQKKLVVEPAIVKRLMPVDALQIRGDHNALNALAALALCRAIELPLAPLLHGLREYRGEPHRVERIARIADVDYVDDSKGTNVGATVAALEGAGQKVVLIAGGEGKGQDFSPLAAPIARHARAVILIGKDGPTIRAAVTDAAAASGVALIDVSTMAEAVNRASTLAQAGDMVLLSPACASLDMFRDYKHRADVFAAAVQELALEAGQPC